MPLSTDHNGFHNAEYRALLQIAQLVTTFDLEHVLSEILRIMIDVFEAKKGSIILIDRDGSPYRRFILQRHLPPETSRITVGQVMQNGLAGWCVREKRGAAVADVSQDERWLIFVDEEHVDVHSAMCVPLLFENEVQGVMTLVSNVTGHFTDNHLELATAIAGQASIVVHNAYLFDEVQTHRRQLDTIFQSMGEPLFLLNRHLEFQLVNPEAALLLNASANALIGKRIDTLSDKLIWKELATKLTEADFSSGHQVFELYDNITERDFRVTVAVVDSDAELFGYIIIFIDVTSMKDFSRLKSHMLRMARHDLKNPLNIALGYTNMIQIDLTQDLPVNADWIDEIFRSLERLNGLIDELLDEERAERESKFRSGMINPYSLLQDVVVAMEDQLTWKHQRLVQNIATDLPPFEGDHAQLRQAMINYLSNASKYTPENGLITITAYTAEERFLFTIEDTGIGIPVHLQHDIFRRGYRADRDAISDITGSGVGLSLVAEICRRHKGSVWFTSQEGIGSIFGFSIPLQSTF